MAANELVMSISHVMCDSTPQSMLEACNESFVKGNIVSQGEEVEVSIIFLHNMAIKSIIYNKANACMNKVWSVWSTKIKGPRDFIQAQLLSTLSGFHCSLEAFLFLVVPTRCVEDAPSLSPSLNKQPGESVYIVHFLEWGH
jgi:hypothetical protein